MSTSMTALNQILIMFFLIIIGVISYKVKLVDKDTNKRLSDLVLMLINPIVIFISYQREFNTSLLKGLLISLLLAVLTHVIGILISIIFLKRKCHEDDISMERFAVIYSNCGFMGIPLVNGIFGSEGVFYITAYVTVFNLFIWTHGVIGMTGKNDKETLVKAILSPSILATILGFTFFVARIQFPNIAVETLNYIGSMNTPMAMLVAGVTIAQTNILKVFTRIRIYYISFLKLIIVPVVVLLLYRLFPIPEVVMLTAILASTTPTAATINLFAIKYDKDYLYASEIFAVATILSIITIPAVMTLADYLL